MRGVESERSLARPLSIDHDQAVDGQKPQDTTHNRLSRPKQAGADTKHANGDKPCETADVAGHVSAADLRDTREQSLRLRVRSGR